MIKKVGSMKRKDIFLKNVFSEAVWELFFSAFSLIEYHLIKIKNKNMKDLLHKVCPLTAIYFGETGLSATLANSKKNENANENAYLIRDIHSFNLYETHLTIVSDKGTQVNKVSINKLKPENFDVLSAVAKNNGENALLGNAIKIFNESMDLIKKTSAQKLVEFNNGDVTLPELPQSKERKLSVIAGTVDSIVQMERVEEIVANCTASVLERLDASLIKKALKLESEAATLGNVLTKKDCFLQIIIAAEPELATQETVANFALVIKQPKLAYSPDEVESFKNLFLSLQKKYQNIQGQLNGIKKTIKDTIRMTDVEFAKDYESNLAVFRKEYQIYQDKVNQINAQGEVLRQQLVQELLKLKILTE
jgi:hypothetical protein